MSHKIFVKHPETGEKLNLREAAEVAGVSYGTMSNRYKKGKRGRELFLNPHSAEFKALRSARLSKAGRKRESDKKSKDIREQIKSVLSDRSNLLLSRPMGKDMCR